MITDITKAKALGLEITRVSSYMRTGNTVFAFEGVSLDDYAGQDSKRMRLSLNTVYIPYAQDTKFFTILALAQPGDRLDFYVDAQLVADSNIYDVHSFKAVEQSRSRPLLTT